MQPLINYHLRFKGVQILVVSYALLDVNMAVVLDSSSTEIDEN
jgi:hypothetical protein